jgi:multidrug efflux pump subunit AcrB
MILLFLGSWRSTLIIAISIPLSILASIISLSALGETINIMTLGGLALAVGILVDDATVTIENINSHLEEGKEVYDAIMEGAHQIAVPALVSTLSICIVFVPIFFLGGVAKYLFAPLAEAVVFAMLASYVLSRTLVPTLSLYWLQKHDHDAKPTGPFGRFQHGFESRFERIRNGYRGALETTEKRVRCRWDCWCHGWGAIFSRTSTVDRSSCTFVRRLACASKKPRGWPMASRASSGKRFPRRN